MIVDDNEANLFSLVKILEKLNYPIHTAKSGFEAIDLTDTNEYSLVLLDIQMPEMDGFQVLEHIRSKLINKYTPVILISAIFTESQYRLKGIQIGAVDFLPKPIDPAILQAKVKVFLELEEHKDSLKKLISELATKNELLKTEIEKRKKVEAKLRVAKKQAEKISENKSQLLVNMSHEIRTPVNSILGFADLIANPNLSKTDKDRYVKYVSNSSQNLLFLINEILDHSRIESGEFKLNKAPCRLSDMMVELKESFDRIKVQQEKEDLEIILDLPSEQMIIETDPQRVKQVMINLLSNAVKYTDEGYVKIGYKLEGKYIKLFIIDSGIGISEDEIGKVFQRFKRVETQNSLKAQGTGLGLSIASRVVELLGGKIGVTSKIDVGSEFYFTLPYTPLVDENKEPSSEKEIFVEDPDWSNHSIVIAEDEEMNFMFLQEALRTTKIEIIWAKNGHEAVAKSLELEPDLILMDIKMPDINGFEAVSLIKKQKPHLIIIIQTAFAKTDDELTQREKNYDDMITKPINRNDLFKTMSKYLSE